MIALAPSSAACATYRLLQLLDGANAIRPCDQSILTLPSKPWLRTIGRGRSCKVRFVGIVDCISVHFELSVGV